MLTRRDAFVALVLLAACLGTACKRRARSGSVDGGAAPTDGGSGVADGSVLGDGAAPGDGGAGNADAGSLYRTPSGGFQVRFPEGKAPEDPSATSIAILELGNDEAFVGSRVVWLPFGTYHVRAHSEGYVDETHTISPKAPDPMTVTITLDRVKGETAPITSTIPGPKPRVAGGPEIERASRPGVALPIATTTVTAAAVVLAVVSRARAGSKADRAVTSLDPATFQDDKNAAATWNTTFVVGTSMAVVGVVASVLLWHRALAAPELEVQATTTSFSLGYTARF